MLSSLSNPGTPPLLSPESQTPSLFRRGLANMHESLNGPKGKIAFAMLQQQLGKMGGLVAPGRMTRRPSRFDHDGNPIV